MKQIILLFAVVLTAFTSYSQKIGVQGKVMDQQGNGLKAITLELLNEKDSSLITSVLSDEKGNFVIDNKRGHAKNTLRDGVFGIFFQAAFNSVTLHIVRGG